MITFLFIYILGIIATLWVYCHNLSSGYEISLAELLAVILGCLCSWVTFIIMIIVIYGDEIVFTKK